LILGKITCLVKLSIMLKNKSTNLNYFSPPHLGRWSRILGKSPKCIGEKQRASNRLKGTIEQGIISKDRWAKINLKGLATRNDLKDKRPESI